LRQFLLSLFERFGIAFLSICDVIRFGRVDPF
jgi:hypothetical protein